MATPSTLILPYTGPGVSSAGNSTKYSLVGRSMNRIAYRRYNSAAAGSPAIADNDTTSGVNTRAQASIDIRTQVKAPGALGNDRMRISLKDTYLGADNLYHTDSVECSFSFGRDINSNAARRKALIVQLVCLLGIDDGTNAWGVGVYSSGKAAQCNAQITMPNIARMSLDMVESTVPGT